MIWALFLLFTSIKLLLVPAYHSTDFEVHRNWLALTHSLPISKWYHENTSEWTLDYPPFFAYFEYGLSQIAQYIDPKMLRVDNLNYDDYKAVLFQRMSVMLTDIVYVLGVIECLKSIRLNKAKSSIVAFSLLGNIGLLMIDHIHFQYNGILFGIFLLSIGKMLQRKYIQSALLFAILLNMKHIFIYVAPVYVVYLLKYYCIPQNALKVTNLFKLGTVVATTCLFSFGPFYDQLPQVLSRLFPFKRGLSHAYWAPNFWALYNFCDKVISIALKIKSKNSSTSGLVQTFEHDFLPSISPAVTFLLTALFMAPCLIKLALSRNTSSTNFIRAIVICGGASFAFGWHVHEKAILMIMIPASLLIMHSDFDGKFNVILGIVGHYSLFPLLFKPELTTIKLFLYLYYISLSILAMMVYSKSKLRLLEHIYLIGYLLLFIYENILHFILGHNVKLPFLPLMLTSVYCSVGVLYVWLNYYWHYLSASEPKKKV